MFDQIFKRPLAIKKHSEAPLLKERWRYIQYWVDNGAALGTIQRISHYLLVIINYLKFYKIRKVEVKEIKKGAHKWASRTCPRYIKKENSNVAKEHFVRYAVGWFKLLGCLALPEKPSLPFEEQLNQYMVHMCYEQGLSEVTMTGRICILRDFLQVCPRLLGSFVRHPCHTSAAKKAGQLFFVPAAHVSHSRSQSSCERLLVWLYAVSYIFCGTPRTPFRKKFYGYRRLPAFASLSLAGSERDCKDMQVF